MVGSLASFFSSTWLLIKASGELHILAVFFQENDPSAHSVRGGDGRINYIDFSKTDKLLVLLGHGKIYVSSLASNLITIPPELSKLH